MDMKFGQLLKDLRRAKAELEKKLKGIQSMDDDTAKVAK